MSRSDGRPSSASTIVGRVVMRSSSTMRGLVSATNPPIRVRGVAPPWTRGRTPPGASEDGTSGRLPTAIAS